MSATNDKGAALAAPTPSPSTNRGGRPVTGGSRPSGVTLEGVGCDDASLNDGALYDHLSVDVNTLSSTNSEQPPQNHTTGLIEAAKGVIASASDTYKKRNGHLGSFEDDSGEKCWIVPFDAFEALRSAVATTEGRNNG